MTDKVKITTDLVIGAVRATQSVYEGYAIKLAARGHFESAVREINRAALMQSLASDDNLCEMLAGRIYQLGHGVP